MDKNVKIISSTIDRININEASEVSKWCKKFKISPQELKIAVIEVGNRVMNIEIFLRNRMDVIF